MLDQLQQFRTVVQVDLRKVFLAKEMPRFTPAGSGKPTPDLAEGHLLIRDHDIRCRFQQRHSETVGNRTKSHATQSAMKSANIPEYVSRFTISSLQYLGRQIHLVAFSLKAAPAIQSGPSRPYRSHSKVPYFEAPFPCYEDIRGLQVQVDDASIMDKSKTLEWPRHENEQARQISPNARC
jgi:hypothetical protein